MWKTVFVLKVAAAAVQAVRAVRAAQAGGRDSLAPILIDRTAEKHDKRS